MSDPILQEVLFPAVEPKQVVILTVRLERMTQRDGKERFCHGHGRIAPQEVLFDARASEPEVQRLAGVAVKFLPTEGDGSSHGLALALADKLLRYAAGREPGDIIATGVIVRGGRGRIGEIDSYARKASAVADMAEARPTPLTFAFPRSNWDKADDDLKARLRTLEDSGRLVLRPADRIEDLEDLWRRPETARKRTALWAAATGAAVVAVLAAAGVYASQAVGPALGCEASIRRLDKHIDDVNIRTALDTCGRAVEADEDNGRLRFLLGQAYALNGGGPLADREWEASARLGDKDGMATWGRRLWLMAPQDAAQVRAAIPYLERAAAAGSAAAADDLGNIYLDGAALPIDHEAAEEWFRKAKDMRRRERK